MDKEQLLDSVFCILDHSLAINNQQTSWLRTQADLSFALKHYWSCMKFFMHLGVVATDYFSEPLTKNVYDDQVYKKMIHSCIQLNLHTQAAVLCQFLEDVDYPTAFKCLQERGTCFDAMDAYYRCIWDVTMLEYIINMHHRKGEIEKRNFAVHLVGKLEMNSNNRADVQYELSKMKKAQFMRILCQQFLVKTFNEDSTPTLLH
ncbi:hypothetical protein HELRODRAFT_76904 [Helobdella robusta]|uniref:INTS8 TPR repeats domain-containing protein n=1 Tax=Helobdella robusta TaxID=6412 RepID=T1G2Q8_HELRO|nr:hypothetical protein HELRODRAFT_76904 [Helobdella robusta]ESO06848.1 hypothetical protein HELRODRAFT_76904 [Helobdella robusta]